MHITMRVACRIARACTREVATSVFTLAGLIVSAVAHAPCAVAFCSDAIQVIDSSTGIHRGKMEKRLEGGDFTKLLWLFKNLCRSRIYKRNISSVALQLVRKMVETLVNFDEIWKDWVDFSRWQCWLICMNEWTIKLKRIDIEIVIFSARFCLIFRASYRCLKLFSRMHSIDFTISLVFFA